MSSATRPAGTPGSAGRRRALRVLAFPRNETNPYQDLLATDLAALGVVVGYLPAETPSQTLNVLLLPWSLLWRRFQGFRLLHIHWTYLFAPVWVERVPGGRRCMEAWFLVFLLAARALGYQIVWTAHNLVPHGRVFHDDRASRRRLVRLVDAVIAHDVAVLPDLAELGARDVRVVREGSYAGHYPDDLDRDAARTRLGLDPADRVIACVGTVAPYKAVDWLLEAAADVPPASRLRVVVAGRCADPALARRLQELAARVPGRVLLHLGYVPDDELQVYLRSADVTALPYRRVTNSGSALLAFSFGLPVLVPDLAELAGIPGELALRYEPTRDGLAEGLRRLDDLDGEALRSMGERAKAYGDSLTWAGAASATAALYGELCGVELVEVVDGGGAVPDGPGDEVVVVDATVVDVVDVVDEVVVDEVAGGEVVVVEDGDRGRGRGANHRR